MKTVTGQEMLERAINAALTVHAGVTDKSGTPYILHPLRVMDASMAKARAGGLENVILEIGAAAVMHDVVEDGPPGRDQKKGRLFLQMLDMPLQVIDLVLAVSHKDGESYETFVKRAGRHSYGALVIKRADIQDNLRPGCPPFLQARYVKALKVLAEMAEG